MKKLILVLIACTALAFKFLNAQKYEFNVKKLSDQFAEIYTHTDKKSNYMARLMEGSRVFFSMNNAECQAAVTGLRKRYKLSIDSSANILLDTILAYFVKDHLWDDQPELKDKHISFYQLYNEKLCPCIQKKIQQSPRGMLEEKDIAGCVGDLTMDTSYINGARRTMGNLTMNQVYAISQVAGFYLFEHCEALYDYFSRVIRHESVYMYLNEVRDSLFSMDKTIARLYQLKSPELKLRFPSYKKYDPDLRSASPVIGRKETLNLLDWDTDSAGQLTVTRTYYSSKGNKPELYGQLVFVIKEEVPDAPVLSFRFISAGKMKDRDMYLKKIGDEEIPQPPPAGEMLKEVRIDTLQRRK